MSAVPAGSAPIEGLKPFARGAGALVLATTLAFWVGGAIRSTDDAPAVAPTTEGTGSTDPGSDGSPVPIAPVDGAGEDADPTTAATTPDAATEGTTTPSPSTSSTGESLAPASISIQVLDAVRDDDGAAAEKVADRLREAGYDVVVINAAAVTYEKTTVFWSGENSIAANQVASAFGFTEVSAKPDNLSASVMLHVVVGRDQR